MKDLKEIIAENLTRLRQESGLTQLQLAEMLNYSDKAVSKWERGESIPDLRVLIQLAALYNIKLDDIVREQPEKIVKPKLNLKKQRVLITLLSMGFVWVVATVVFMILYYTAISKYSYLSFVIAPICSSILFIIFSALWFNRPLLTIAVSLTIWSAVLIVHMFLNLFAPQIPWWPFYMVAGAANLLVIGWFVLRRLYKPKKKND